MGVFAYQAVVETEAILLLDFEVPVIPAPDQYRRRVGVSAAEGAAASNAFQSGYWGGIGEVLDATGTPVAFTMTSESGTDWTVSRIPAVPEPSTYWLFGAGLLALVASRRFGKPLVPATSR